MTLESTAQGLIVVDPSSIAPMGGGMPIVPLEVHDQEMGHDHEHGHSHEEAGPLEVSDSTDEPLEVIIDIDFSDLPGAPKGTKDPVIEVKDAEDDLTVKDEDPVQSAKNEKWDWSKRGPTGFIAWVKERCSDVPGHSGYDSAGLERAIAYLERLDGEVSKAMRLDLDGELDADQIEKVRAIIDNGIERLQDRLDKVKTSKKKSRKKKSELEVDGLIKEAQKVTGVQGIYIVAPLFASRIARVCINGMVSAGHDIEDLYARQVKKYNLSDREQAEVMQLLADMGYPLRQDRGFMPDEDVDIASSDNMDWAANYKG